MRMFLVYACPLECLKYVWRTNAGMHDSILDLAGRLDIAIDVAHAVTYLHMYTGWCNVG